MGRKLRKVGVFLYRFVFHESPPRAAVASFGYFFASQREHGLRLSWTASQLAAGGQVLEALCEKIAARTLELSDVDRVRVAARKPHAPIDGPVDYVEVVLERHRGDFD